MSHGESQLAIERQGSAVLRTRVEAERARAAELEGGLRRLVSELESETGPTAAVLQACSQPPTLPAADGARPQRSIDRFVGH